METIIKDAECMQVEYATNGQKATLTFYDTETGEIREVNFNKQKYDSAKGKFINDEQTAERCEKTIADDLGLTFNTLTEAVGMKKDLFCYPTFNSLHHVDLVEKFTMDMNGEIYSTTIKDILDDGKAIKIHYEIDGETYESKMSYAGYLEKLKIWAVDPNKKERQFNKFKEKFLVPFKEADTLIGKSILVEVKVAMGKYPYGEIKKLRKE